MSCHQGLSNGPTVMGAVRPPVTMKCVLASVLGFICVSGVAFGGTDSILVLVFLVLGVGQIVFFLAEDPI